MADENEHKKLSAQEFLAKNSVHSLLEELTAELVRYKPNAPIDYMIGRISDLKDKIPSDRKNAYFVLGPPGSGKGTICARLVDRFGFTKLTIADILAAEVRSGSDEGKTIEQITRDGGITPKEIIIPLLLKEIKAHPNSSNFLMDGFPREMSQALMFESNFFECRLTLYLECPEEVCKKRLAARHEQLKTPTDAPDVVVKRFDVFNTQTLPVIQYFDALGKVRVVDAGAALDQVWKAAELHFLPTSL